MSEIRLLTFDLADIGRLAVDAERARRKRLDARQAFRTLARSWYAEDDERDKYHEDGGLDPEYVELTDGAYKAYLDAGKESGVATRRFRRAVAKFDAANAKARVPSEVGA